MRIHQPIESTGLARFIESSDAGHGSPYWAWCWAGGLALAHHLFANPEIVAGKRVVDLGSGSGLVAIAAAKAGAQTALAVDIDPHATLAQCLNAAANQVELNTLCADCLDSDPFTADLVTVGDLFYEPVLSVRVLACLERYHATGNMVLIGDPGRAFLPRERLELLASYQVPEFGDAPRSPLRTGEVFGLRGPFGQRACRSD